MAPGPRTGGYRRNGVAGSITTTGVSRRGCLTPSCGRRGFKYVRRLTPSMRTLFLLGVVLVVAGLAGYVVGIAVPYPGRGFSLTAVMAGLAVALVGRADPGGSP